MGGDTTYRQVNPKEPDEEVIQEMAFIMKQGGLIVFPTETFYGLGANALDEGALERIYHLKGRPLHLPLLCLVDRPDRLKGLVRCVHSWTQELMETFWPGPLTLVFPAKETLPGPLLGPTGGVAIRWSVHPVAQFLVASLRAPVVGTSANLSGEPAPIRIQDICRPIRDGVQGILDAGKTSGGAPSTVLDCTRWPARILREGAISGDALRPFCRDTHDADVPP